MKTCKRCNKEQQTQNFFKDSKTKDGLRIYCKSCEKIRHQNWCNTDEGKQSKKRRYNKYYNSGKGRIWHQKYNLKKFGLTLEDYMKMLIQQNGLCKICNEPEKDKATFSNNIRSLAVDHCHKTNKVRGLLCSRCNKVLGLFNDNVGFFEEAISYLRKPLT